MVMATAASSARAAPVLVPIDAEAVIDKPTKPTAAAAAAERRGRSPKSHQAGTRMRSGCAFDKTAATPAVSPAEAANIAAKAMVTLNRASALIWAHSLALFGWGRCCA